MAGYNIHFDNIQILLPSNKVVNYSIDFETNAISVYQAASNFASRINYSNGPKSLLYSCEASTVINGERIVFHNLGIKEGNYKYDKVSLPDNVQKLFDNSEIYENKSHKIVIKNKKGEILSFIESNKLTLLEFLDLYAKLKNAS